MSASGRPLTGQPALAATPSSPAVSPLTGFDQAQGRDYRGRFLRKVRETPEGSCEWLIWSRYWRSWHRKSREGGAAGYTDDIAEAGLFPRSTAVQYNDDRDTPYHVSEKMGLIEAAIAQHDKALMSLRRAASVGRNAERQDAAERLGPEDEHAVPSQTADAQPSPERSSQ